MRTIFKLNLYSLNTAVFFSNMIIVLLGWLFIKKNNHIRSFPYMPNHVKSREISNGEKLSNHVRQPCFTFWWRFLSVRVLLRDVTVQRLFFKFEDFSRALEIGKNISSIWKARVFLLKLTFVTSDRFKITCLLSK